MNLLSGFPFSGITPGLGTDIDAVGLDYASWEVQCMQSLCVDEAKILKALGDDFDIVESGNYFVHRSDGSMLTGKEYKKTKAQMGTLSTIRERINNLISSDRSGKMAMIYAQMKTKYIG